MTTSALEVNASHARDELGPIATFGAQVFVFFAILFSFQVTGYTVFPGITPVALAAGMIGVIALTPRPVLGRVPISLLVLALTGLMAASTLWTANPTGTALAVQRDLPLIIGLVFAVGTIPMNDLVAALVWAVRVAVVVSLVAVALLPEARTHIDPNGVMPELAGWHGLFPHKNIMTAFLVFGLVTVLTYDRSFVPKWGTVLLSGVLIVGSDSVTGIAGALLAVSLWVWFQLYQNLDIRGSTIFFFSSLSLAFFAIIGLVASLASLLAASGRDLTFTGRTFIWDATFDAFERRPFLGYGLNAMFFADDVTPETAEVWRAIGFQVPHAHNGFLNVAIQLGVVGLVVYLALFTSTFAAGVRTVTSDPKLGTWIVTVMVVQLFIAISEAAFITYGWLLISVMFRVLSMRGAGAALDPATADSPVVERSVPSETPSAIG